MDDQSGAVRLPFLSHAAGAVGVTPGRCVGCSHVHVQMLDMTVALTQKRMKLFTEGGIKAIGLDRGPCRSAANKSACSMTLWSLLLDLSGCHLGPLANLYTLWA